MADSGMPVIRPQMGTYVCTQPDPNCIFSDVQPETIFELLKNHLQEKDIAFQIRDDKWKMTFQQKEISQADIPLDKED